jgi:hypothetical protein
MKDRLFILEFLKRLEDVIPPPTNCHHAITYAQHGSDLEGWTDKLAVHVHAPGVKFDPLNLVRPVGQSSLHFQTFFLEAEDEDKSVMVLVEEIRRLLQA